MCVRELRLKGLCVCEGVVCVCVCVSDKDVCLCEKVMCERVVH